ncbi:MAG: cation-translocating P-type ATPase [Candidatus Hodarchaeota archaeon]
MTTSGEHEITPVPIQHPHATTLAQLQTQLEADTTHGITGAEALRRLEIYGRNELPHIRGSFWRVYLAPIFNGLILIYLVAIALMALLVIFFQAAGAEQALIWVVVIAFNAVLAIVQQYRAQKKLAALQSLTADTIVVFRDGLKQEIDASEVVPGDLLVLAQGDRIPADGRLIEANQLSVVESSLTGESAPVEKSVITTALLEETPIHERTSMVYRGTHVATGSGRILVSNTGESTEIGGISEGLETLNTGEIPLRRKVNRLALYLGTAALIFGIVGFGSYLLFPRPVDGVFPTLPELAMEAIINAMTVAPINIPLLTTIILLTGVLAMAGLGVIVSDLSAVESLGRVSVVCTDKTGTLTRSEMMVDLIWDGTNLFHVSGAGYTPSGTVHLVNKDKVNGTSITEEPIDVEDYQQLSLLIRIGGLNNDAHLEREEIERDLVSWKAVGDPTEAALLVLLEKSGVSESSLRSAYPMVHDFPFDSALKRMTRIFRHPEGDYVAFIKGATDVLLERSTQIGDDRTNRRLTKKQSKYIQQYANGFASGGYRVLSFAVRRFDELPKGRGSTLREAVEQDLTYVGFVGILDPPREGVREAVQEVAEAGIKTVMITGDAAATAETIGRQLAIVHDDDVVIEGEAIKNISNENFGKVSVFARVDPDDKQIIVERFKATNRVVAVTGDGVNDALALSMSDVGIAMGITGTDVAKEAADMIIADDSYTSIVEGIRQGRGLFNKIRAMILFYITINVAESIIFFLTFFLGFRFLTPWQHIFLAISSHSWPGLALVFDSHPKFVMKEQPRDTEAILTPRLGSYLIINAILIAVSAIIAFFGTLTYLFPGTPIEIIELYSKAQVMTISVLLLTESLMILSIRRINQSVYRSMRYESFWFIYFMLAFVFLMHLGLMYIPQATMILSSLNINFDYYPLTGLDWLIVFALSLPALAGMEVYKWANRRSGKTF